MPRIRAVALVVAVLAGLAGSALAATRSQSPAAGGGVVQASIHSRAIHGTLRFAVWVPPGYAQDPQRRYPVLYVLHGLPGSARSYRSLFYLVPVLESMDAQAIVVFPQGARAGDVDDEYLDLGPSRNWATALTRELPAAVATRFRTLPGRTASGIVGISAGGYGATILGLHNLSRYSVIESWSGYFHATTPDGGSSMSLPPRETRWADAHALIPQLAAKQTSDPTLLAFYIGSSDPYTAFTAENRQFDQELTAAGVLHTFAVYPGGHNTVLWLAHAAAWLGLALQTLTPAQ